MMSEDVANKIMPSVQQLLFPDPRPLVERLGREFFRELPECPGVYLMRDAGNSVLYVGKALNLRKRLGSYRVANPDRMARRQLRLLRSVARIELEPCANETVALAREAELLRELRPKFNRAGTWPGKARYLAWRSTEQMLVLAVLEKPVEGWQMFGPLGGGAIYLRAVLARLVWFAVNPEASFTAMPAGWMHYQFEDETEIRCGQRAAVVNELLEELLVRQVGGFCERLRRMPRAELHPFERAALDADLEYITNIFLAEIPLATATIANARPEREA